MPSKRHISQSKLSKLSRGRCSTPPNFHAYLFKFVSRFIREIDAKKAAIEAKKAADTEEKVKIISGSSF